MILKNKRILITAGPTWVAIDSVRVISNIATGETGMLLAEQLNKRGSKVTLLLGPTAWCCPNKKVRLIRFKFYEELKSIIIRSLKSENFDLLIHTAAVSDYAPKTEYRGKIKSGIKNLKLELVPTDKIISLVKKINPGIFLIGFKYETKPGKAKLIKNAKELMGEAGLDLAVANIAVKNRYQAYILDKEKKIYASVNNKKEMAQKLVKLMGDTLCRN